MSVSSPSHAAGFSASTTQVGSARVGMHVGGSGRPLVLFHSLLADRGSWDRVAPVLAEQHRVIALDLPGFAGSDFVDGGLEAVADRVAAALGQLELGEQPILMGNGYGGFVALMTAIRHPGLAHSLVLADCGAAFSEPGRAAFRGMSAAAGKGGLEAIADVAMRRLFAPAYQAEHPDLIAERKERFLAIDPRTFHAACAALASLDLRDQLAGVKVPALVVVGEMDEATPPPMSHRTRRRASGRASGRAAGLRPCAAAAGAATLRRDGRGVHRPQVRGCRLKDAHSTEVPLMGIVLYGYWRSLATFRVRAALNLKKLEYTETIVDLAAGEQHEPAFAAINPQHVLPVLEHEGLRLVQSLAIVEYLDERWPSIPLLPADAAGRARVRALAQIASADVHPLIVPRVRQRLAQKHGVDADGQLDWARHWLDRGTAAIEARLREGDTAGPYAHGERVTLADLALVSHVIGARLFGADLVAAPRLQAVADHCLALPEFATAHPLRQPGAPAMGTD